MTGDLSIIGIVFAIILFIIFFAAVILYLSFRIKETFREEKKRGMLVVKIGFLIGILFLAGGSFYFFAQILSPSTSPTLPFPSNGNGEPKPELTLSVSYPTDIRMSTQITMTLTITNPTNLSANDVIVQTNSLFEHFSLISSTDTGTSTSVCKLVSWPPQAIKIRPIHNKRYLDFTLNSLFFMLISF